jgi:hypothetical protein
MPARAALGRGAALPPGNKMQRAPKQSISPAFISLCVSLRAYMLDTVAFSAKRPACVQVACGVA